MFWGVYIAKMIKEMMTLRVRVAIISGGRDTRDSSQWVCWSTLEGAGDVLYWAVTAYLLAFHLMMGTYTSDVLFYKYAVFHNKKNSK